jgi:CIC family chloride channel protein
MSESAASAHKRSNFLYNLLSYRTGRWIILGASVGVVSGLGAILFNFLVNNSSKFFFLICLGWTRTEIVHDAFVLNPAEGLQYWLMPLVPIFGGLIGGWLVFTYAPEAEGHGTDAYIKAFHRLRGKIRSHVPIIKTIASAITIGTGGSAGREGPIAQIGAGFGSWLGQALKLDANDCRTLLIAGTAGGVGAIFCAPLGGAIFAIEVLYREQEMETECLIPALISSLVAFSVFTALTGQTQVFLTPEFEFHAIELIPYTFLGLICACIGVLYVMVFYGARDYFFKKIPLKPHYLPMIGGLLLGLLALMRPEVLSGGYGWIEKALNERLDIGFMIVLVFAKMIATSFTISSGGSGGVFGPSLFIGCMLGAAFGHAFDAYFPSMISDPRSFALVGMVAFFSGIAKVPIASLLMIAEMSQSYELLVPMMLVSSLTYILTDRWTLYEEQVRTKADSPVHLGEYRTDVLAGLHVGEITFHNGKQTIPYNMTLRQALPIILDTSQNVFPVLDEDGSIHGVFSVDEIRTLLLEEQMFDLIVAMDIAEPEFNYVTPDEDLHSVLRKLTELVTDEIPVLEIETKHFIGTIKRRDILNIYSKRLYELHQEI